MKCMKNEGLRTFTREEKLDLSRNPSGEGEEVEWEVFGRKIREFLSRKIGEKWKKNRSDSIYRQKHSSMDWQVSRGVEN